MLSIYYLRIAEFLLVGNPTIIKKILDEDLSQGLQGEKCLFLAPPTFKKAFFPACFFKNFREYADKKRTPATAAAYSKTSSSPPPHGCHLARQILMRQSGPQTNQSRAIRIGLHPGVLMPRSYQSHKKAAAGSPKGALF